MTTAHIAGVPSATEQRCVRCCEVIATHQQGILNSSFPTWPGKEVIVGPCGGAVTECKAVELR
jgi:hypothetical protein